MRYYLKSGRWSLTPMGSTVHEVSALSLFLRGTLLIYIPN